MDPGKPSRSSVIGGGSDLGIPSELQKQPMRVYVTRIPYDDFFKLQFVKEGRDVSEELLPEDTLAWFMDHMTKPLSREAELARNEMISKALDEAWNFYENWITIPAELYQEPVKPYPRYQPQV